MLEKHLWGWYRNLWHPAMNIIKKKTRDESKTAHPSASVQKFLIQIGFHGKTMSFTILPLVWGPMNDKIMGKELKKNITVIGNLHDVFLSSERLDKCQF
jgi:hypothetical protein